MKYPDTSLKSIVLTKLTFLGIVIFATTTVPVSAFDHNGMYTSKPAITNGPAYLLPKILPIHRFDLNAPPCVGADAGRLQIDLKGNAKLYILNSKVASMKSLDKNLTRETLGIPTGPQGEDENKPYYWTFDVMTIDPLEQNIYHIDVQFADADQHWKEYRVRGYRIGNPQWQVVE